MADLSEKPSKFEITKALADLWATKIGPSIATAPYHAVEQFMKGGYQPGTQDAKGVANAADISTLLMGTGVSVAKPGLGSFGGKGAPGTTPPNEALKWLESQKPVDLDWVKNWTNDAGLVIKKEKLAAGDKANTRKTTYLDIEDPSNPGNVAKVRVPGPADRERHYGFAEGPKSAGNYFDTGYGFPIEAQNKANPRNYSDHSLLNQSNQSYASQEALDQALRLKFFGKAPHGDLKLVSPEYAPIKPEPGVPTPPRERRDPNQLKLLSGGYTPADILQILKQQGQSQNGTP